MRTAGAIALAFVLTLGVSGGACAQDFRRFIPLDMRGALGLPNCSQIASAINRGVDRKQPGALLSAGWMHERGHCVTVDIDKAYSFYGAAFDRGENAAAERLAGMASTREGGRDLVATLWWARKSKWKDTIFGNTGACDPVPGQSAVDEDAFIAAVKTWPQAQAQTCLADVGLRSLILADMRYTPETLSKELEGTVDVRYELQKGTYTVTPGSGDGGGLAKYVTQVLDDAMSRAARAPGPTTGQFRFVFRLSY